MKFINTLNNRILNKTETYVREIVLDVLSRYQKDFKDQKEYLSIIESQVNKVNRDIVYIAEALKHTHMLLQELDQSGEYFLEDDDSPDKTFH